MVYGILMSIMWSVILSMGHALGDSEWDLYNFLVRQVFLAVLAFVMLNAANSRWFLFSKTNAVLAPSFEKRIKRYLETRKYVLWISPVLTALMSVVFILCFQNDPWPMVLLKTVVSAALAFIIPTFEIWSVARNLDYELPE